MFGGCKLKYVPMNDASVALGKHDPQLGAANITGLAGDASVVGVVGPFNSSVAAIWFCDANDPFAVYVEAVASGVPVAVVLQVFVQRIT